MKQDTVDVAAWVQGEPLQTVQWDEYGGFEINFKAFAIGVPLIRTDPQIEAALIIAARAMDATSTGPARPWTRAGHDVAAHGHADAQRFPIESGTSIPQQLKDAQCEWAYQLLAGVDFTSDNDAAKQGISSVKAGSVAVSFQSVDSSTFESVDMFIRRLGSEFNYLTAPGEVRRLLVESWFNQPSIFRPLEFIVFGGSNGAC
jgi:hypothetical protein